MKIEHIALWTNDLEKSKKFYCDFFGGVSNTKYTNEAKKFESYFITFESGCRLEIMTTIGLNNSNSHNMIGIAHFAFRVGSEEKVDQLTEHLRDSGVIIQGAPRKTGDGYYESIILDPDGNFIEIVA